MIKVKLKSDQGYTPSIFNPVMNSNYECNGELIYVTDKELKHHVVNSIMLINGLEPKTLARFPMVVKWNNDVHSNICYYKLSDLIYYKEDDKPKFKSIW